VVVVPHHIWATIGILVLLLAAGFVNRGGTLKGAEYPAADSVQGADGAFARLPGAPAFPPRHPVFDAEGAADRASEAHTVAARPSVAAPGVLRPVIAVSIEQRRLWLYDGGDIVHSAPVAVGTGNHLKHGARSWHFATPRGRRVVLGKEEARVWVPPDWHYVELAQEHGFRLSHLSRGKPVALSGGRRLSVRGDRIVLRQANGQSEVLPGDEEVIFDGTLYIPPFGTLNRRIPGELGAFALDIGDGYLIHGTPDTTSIGRAASHGCIRLLDDDIRKLFEHVPVGTPVWIH
jgi:hypothetical protein